MRTSLLVTVCCLGLTALPVLGLIEPQGSLQDPKQDPKKPAKQKTVERVKPPVSRAPLRPIHDLPRSSVDRRDLLQKFAGESPLEGLYKLTRVAAGGGTERADHQGFLHIGRRYLMMQLQLTGPDGKPEFFHSGVRQYTLHGDVLQMITVMGNFKAGSQPLIVEPTGKVEIRQIKRIGTKLRIIRSKGRTMEFTRIE